MVTSSCDCFLIKIFCHTLFFSQLQFIHLLATNKPSKSIRSMVALFDFHMRGSRKVCHRRSNFDVFWFFLVDEGREDKNTTISWPSLFKWRFAGGPIMAHH